MKADALNDIGSRATHRAPPVSRAPMEHRWGRRIACSAPVRIGNGTASVVLGRLRNVSMSGAFVETEFSPALHSPVVIAILREGEPEREMHGSVVRKESGGFAIEWLEATPGAVCPMLGCKHLCPAALGIV